MDLPGAPGPWYPRNPQAPVAITASSWVSLLFSVQTHIWETGPTFTTECSDIHWKREEI